MGRARKEMEPMSPSPMMCDWARHLLAYQAAPDAGSVQAETTTFLVYEKLRQRLRTPIGTNGFQALASRALTLARSEAPSLNAVQITPEGSLRGLGELEEQINLDQCGEAGVIFIAHLLGLFLTFLGAATTRRLVQDIFPHLEAPADSGTPTPFEGILQEVNNLRSVSDTLESLANEHPAVEDGLLTISGNIRNIATILDVFAVVRSASDAVREAEPHQPSTKYLM
jgi:hypothetical protein